MIAQGWKDLENLICQSKLNRPDIAGPVDYTQSARPWFRDHVVLALDVIQKPYHTDVKSGGQVELWTGEWRGLETDTSLLPGGQPAPYNGQPPDPQYGAVYTQGMPYPPNYRKMRYVYLINPTTGRAHKRPLESMTEEQFNTEYHGAWWGNDWDNWLWYGFVNWGFGDWCGGLECGRVRWMDREGMFYLPFSPLNQPGAYVPTFRMHYLSYQTAPTDQNYNNNDSPWILKNMFHELATLVEALLWKSMGEDENAVSTMQVAETLIGNYYRLDRGIKAGSNSRVFVPPSPGMGGQRGF